MSPLETELKQNLIQTGVDSKELTPAPPKRVVGRPIQPGEIRNPKGAGAAKAMQTQIWRERLMEMDPLRDKPRMLALFDEIYNQTFLAGQKGKDIVACAEFLMKRSFGDVSDENLEHGAVRVSILGVPAGTQMAIGMKTPAVSPEFDTE